MENGKYVLVYEVLGEMYYEEFGNFQERMHKRVNDLISINGEYFTLVLAGYVRIEFKYVPKEKVICYEPKVK